MRNNLKYIFLFLVLGLIAVSCQEDIETSKLMSDSETLTLVPRVKSFANQYVTKAEYGSLEKKISSLAVLIFNSEGALLDKQELNGAAVTINKTQLNKSGQQGKLQAAKIVMFANISLDKILDANGKSITENMPVTFDDVAGYTCHFDDANTVITSDDLGKTEFAGFPMFGINPEVDLTPTTTQQTDIEVPLKILYAKVNFEIGVDNGNENDGSGMQFVLDGYSVNNVSKATSLTAPEEGAATASRDYAWTSDAAKGSASGTVTLGSTTPAKFTFYVAESRYNPNSVNGQIDLNGIYPSNDWLTSAVNDDVKNYNSLTEEQKAEPQNKLNGVKYLYDNLIQQYKPKLATTGTGYPATGLATYVTVKGRYTDYRGTVWNVNYKIYLGKDNAQNFHVDRNSEYTNILTIKGIRNNDSYGNGDVWIDHRVNVSTANPAGHVKITRETLIDSHIEVRPLRVQWTGDAYDGVRLYLPTNGSSLINWVGIEKFTGENCLESSTYCYAGNQPTGKRKYFTTNLISELQTNSGEFGVEEEDGQKFIYLRNGDCAWIYFDENTSNSEREASIKLTFYSTDGDATHSEVYTIKQRGLQTVGGYAIESYEEYLHSYDSIDKYNLTTSPFDYTQQGLAWGLANKQVSKNTIVSASSLNLGDIVGIQDWVSQRYDFIHSSDVPSGESYFIYTNNNGSWQESGSGTGLAFTDRASAHENMTIIDMGTIPSSAYQYCLSKNKFKEDVDGNHTMDIHWYLPDVYELGAILGANQSSADLSTNSYYWSSQPSFENWDISQYLDVNILREVAANARVATKGSSTNAPRTEKHRIRCIYSSTGVKNVDMSGRAPDGMGGNFIFWMKGWADGGKSSAGFFNYMLPAPTTTTETKTDATPNVTIPTKANSQSSSAEFPYIITEGKNGQIEGFEKNPGDKNNWNKYSLSSSHYYTLRDYPGLSDYTLDKATLTDAYEETSTRKSIVERTSTTSKINKTQELPSTFTLNALDSKLKISFDKNTGNNNPTFIYDEIYSSVSSVSTRYWNKPVYTATTYEMVPEEKTESANGSGDAELDYVTWPTNTINTSKQAIFSTALNRAEKKALEELEKKIQQNSNYQGWSYTVTYSPEPSSLSWDSKNTAIKYETREEGSWVKRKIVKCIITLTATAKLTKSSQITLYNQTSGGNWSNATTTSESTGPTVNTDQLRVYCGNSFTISLADAYKDEYEITKIKVHFSGSNLIEKTGGIFGAGEDEYYARFVDSNIDLSNMSEEISRYGGGTTTLHLPGMDYNETTDNSSGTHQWSGDGRSSVTLVLADYIILDNLTQGTYVYKYETASRNLSKYVIIDRIEVKCTKK